MMRLNLDGHTGTILLFVFACLLLIFSHTAAATLSEIDGQSELLLIPHPREVYYRLRSANTPQAIIKSFVSSIFPASSLPFILLSYARTLLTSVMTSLFPALGNLDIDLLSSLPTQTFPSTNYAPLTTDNTTTLSADPLTSFVSTLTSSPLSSILPPWLIPEVVGLRSLFPFLLVVGLVLYLHHDSSYPYMLHGNRPKLPTLPDLQVAPRLGHRVGSKRGRKLSAVMEEDYDSESEELESELELELDGESDVLCGVGGLVRERGQDLMMRHELSKQQQQQQQHAQQLDCIAEEY